MQKLVYLQDSVQFTLFEMSQKVNFTLTVNNCLQHTTGCISSTGIGAMSK